METDILRTSSQVARRSLALYAAVAAAHGVPRNELIAWLNKEGLTAELSPRELIFLTEPNAVEKERIWMTWFAEAEYVLLWSSGKVQGLPPPTSKCDTDQIIAAVPLWASTDSFISSAELREKQVKTEAEKIYDMNVEVRKARRQGEPIPNGYDKDVVFFRHYAFNWITGYCGQTWDEITPDT